MGLYKIVANAFPNYRKMSVAQQELELEVLSEFVKILLTDEEPHSGCASSDSSDSDSTECESSTGEPNTNLSLIHI